jgi:hypothetical protein
MSNYTKATNFATKDTLPTGDSGKIVKGTEIDSEFNAIASAISSKADTTSPTFTGTPAAPTAVAGSNTTQLATTAFVKTEITGSYSATATLTNKTISGGTITGITDLAVADGGTGVSSLSANAVILGNGTSAVQTVAPGTSDNVLKSNGTTWISAVLLLGTRGQVFTSSGTFTVPEGVTAVKATVVGGGGNGGNASGLGSAAGGGGGGGVAIKYITGLTPSSTISVTVGGVSGTSSFGTFCSATGGETAANATTNYATPVGGNGGSGSGGDINIVGGRGGEGIAAPDFTSNASGGGGGGGGGADGNYSFNNNLPTGVGASGIFGGGGRGEVSLNGSPATGFGNGGGGAAREVNNARTGGSGSAGIVIVEW